MWCLLEGPGAGWWAVWGEYLFPWIILALGVGLLLWQIRNRIRLSTASPSSADQVAENAFSRRRILRRMQISALIIVLGLMLLVGGPLFADRKHPFWAIGYWLVAGLLAVWVMILAAGDLMVGVLHFSRLKHRSDLEQIRLALLADQVRRVQGNGQHRPKQGQDGPSHDQREVGPSPEEGASR